MIDIILFLIIGGSVGMLSGFLGLGGGVLLVPILLSLLKGRVPENMLFQVVTSISLFVAFFSAINASRKHIKNYNYDRRPLVPMIFGTVIGSLLGTYLLKIIPGHYLKLGFGVVLLFLSIKAFFSGSKSCDNQKVIDNIWGFALSGFLIGTFSSITGLGGGVLFVPVLANIFKFNYKKAAGISCIIMVFNTLVANIFRYFLGREVVFVNYKYHVGYVILSIALPLALGAFLVSPVGAIFNHKMQPRTVQRIAGVIFLLISLRIIASFF